MWNQESKFAKIEKMNHCCTALTDECSSISSSQNNDDSQALSFNGVAQNYQKFCFPSSHVKKFYSEESISLFQKKHLDLSRSTNARKHRIYCDLIQVSNQRYLGKY